MKNVEDVLAMILAQARPLEMQRVPLLEAHGRTLAADMRADRDAPPFDNSAVDGYAVRAVDTHGANADASVRMKVTTSIAAGDAPSTAPLLSGTAIRIMTGAPVPPQCDAIVMLEDTQTPDAENVLILEAAQAGQHIRAAGAMYSAGQIVLAAGTLIRAAEIGLLATFGQVEVSIFRPARVAIFSTGDELIEVDAPAAPGKIRDSNRYMLAALVREAGAVIHSSVHLPDSLEATVTALQEAAQSGADIIITAGGVSVGDHDYIKPALEQLGTLDVWRVALKPGKPLAFGRIGETLFFGLPGNPVSAYVTFELFARPALWKMMGHPESSLARRMVQSRLTETVPHRPGRREYVRAVTTTDDTGFQSHLTGTQESHILSSVTQANSLLIVPEEAEDLAAGTIAFVLLLD